MYKLVIVYEEDGSLLELETENRSIARSVKLLEKENAIIVTVTKEVQPREVKFKNIRLP